MKKPSYKTIALSVIVLFAAFFYYQYLKTKTLETKNTVVVDSSNAVTEKVFKRDLIHDKIIDLSGQEITTLPDDLLRNTVLVELNLTNNSLTTLPSQIQIWANLETLRIGDNKLTALPAEIRLFTKLVTLDASNNSITGLPAEIGQLSNLKNLDLSDNDFTEFPNELQNLKGLKTLDLRGNPVVPSHLKSLQDALTNTEILF